MKEVYIARHGPTAPDPDKDKFGFWQPWLTLEPDGIPGVEQVRDTHLLNIEFDVHGMSDFPRCVQSAMILRPRAHWITMLFLRTQRVKEFDELLHDQLSVEGNHLNSVFIQSYDVFMIQERKRLRDGLNRVLSSMKDGQRALLVTHSPDVDVLREEFDPTHPPCDDSINRGDVVILRFDEQNECVEGEHLQ